MARITVGLVFHANCEEADEIIAQIKQMFNIDLVHIQQSYGKLWISKEKGHD